MSGFIVFKVYPAQQVRAFRREVGRVAGSSPASGALGPLIER